MIDYQENGVGKPIIMHVFIHAPYDHYVRAATHFWNSSGLTASFGPSGLHVAVESLEACWSAASTSPISRMPRNLPPRLSRRNSHSITALMRPRMQGSETIIILLLTSDNPFPGLSRVQRSSSMASGGQVTGTELQLDLATGGPRVRVTFDVQPRRILPAQQIAAKNPLDDTRKLVALGMRARIDTSNLVTARKTSAWTCCRTRPRRRYAPRPP